MPDSSEEMSLAEQLRIVADIAGGNKDVWYGQVDVEKEKAAMAAVETHVLMLKSHEQLHLHERVQVLEAQLASVIATLLDRVSPGEDREAQYQEALQMIRDGAS